MGDYVFKLPDVGEGTAEAEIAAWHVRVGDRVEEDQRLVDVLTDKAVVEMTSPHAGIVTRIHGEVGSMAAVGSPLVELSLSGAAAPDTTTATSTPEAVEVVAVGKAAAASTPAQTAPTAPTAKPSAPTCSTAAPRVSNRATGAAPLASPAVRRQAYEWGIPLQFVPSTGAGGRITLEDLQAYAAQPAAAPAASNSPSTPLTQIDDVRIIGMRRKIAEKMQEAKQRIPHINYVEELDLTELEALRQHLNAQRRADLPKLTLLPFFMRALALTVPKFPQINARYDDDAGVLHRHHALHLGVATQTPAGLLVAVVRHVEARDLWDCATELARVAQAARDGKATREELTGSTMTISSLGTLGGIVSTPVINHPEVAIINPNKLVDRPIVKDGQICIRKMMNLSSAFDHRIVDGYDAASFVQTLKGLLEHPATLFMPNVGSHA